MKSIQGQFSFGIIIGAALLSSVSGCLQTNAAGSFSTGSSSSASEPSEKADVPASIGMGDGSSAVADDSARLGGEVAADRKIVRRRLNSLSTEARATREREFPAFSCHQAAQIAEPIGKVDHADLAQLLAMWGHYTTTVRVKADLNHDLDVDGTDLGLVLGCIENSEDLEQPVLGQATAPAAVDALYGDVNLNGVVDFQDVVTLLSFYGVETFDEPQAQAADLNGDGGVDSADLAILLGLQG